MSAADTLRPYRGYLVITASVAVWGLALHGLGLPVVPALSAAVVTVSALLCPTAAMIVVAATMATAADTSKLQDSRIDERVKKALAEVKP